MCDCPIGRTIPLKKQEYHLKRTFITILVKALVVLQFLNLLYVEGGDEIIRSLLSVNSGYSNLSMLNCARFQRPVFLTQNLHHDHTEICTQKCV